MCISNTGVARPSGAYGQGTMRGPQTNGFILVVVRYRNGYRAYNSQPLPLLYKNIYAVLTII